MAEITTNPQFATTPPAQGIGARLLDGLLFIAKKSPTYRALDVYNAKSDEELAALGMTRADIVPKVLGVRMFY